MDYREAAARKIIELEKLENENVNLESAVALALEYPSSELITPGFIQELHELSIEKNKWGWANNCRRAAIGYANEYPLHEDMEFMTHILCDEYNKYGNVDEFVKKLCNLHPFRDGNGRTSRLTYLALTKRNCLIDFKP